MRQRFTRIATTGRVALRAVVRSEMHIESMACTIGIRIAGFVTCSGGISMDRWLSLWDASHELASIRASSTFATTNEISATRDERSSRWPGTNEAMRARLRAPAVDGISPTWCGGHGVLDTLHRDGDRPRILDEDANDRGGQRMSCDGDDEGCAAKWMAHGAVRARRCRRAVNVGCRPSAFRHTRRTSARCAKDDHESG